MLLCVIFGALFRPIPVTSIDSASTAETQNYPDMLNEENEILKPIKNHSFSAENGHGHHPVIETINIFN